MSKDILDEFHRLVAEERYRDARGILESEPDIDPRVAEKWLRWLDDLHVEERAQLGVASDVKKRDPVQAQEIMARHIGGTITAVIASIALWMIIVQVFTFGTSSTAGGGIFMLVGLVAGFYGWQYGAQFISPRRQAVVGAAIALGLFVYVATSGIPMWYYYNPPITYLIAAFLLLIPAAAYSSYRLGAWVGSAIWKRINLANSI